MSGPVDDGTALPVLPEVVATPRLRLPLITPEEREDMLAGRRRPQWDPDFPREDDRDAVSMLPSGDGRTWGSRLVVRAVDGLVVGTIGFHGPPEGGAGGEDGAGGLEAEVGYGLVPGARGRGVATEALRAVLEETDRLGVRLRASVLPENAPSLKVLAGCGFTELRGSNEDGELVMARPLPAAARRE